MSIVKVDSTIQPKNDNIDTIQKIPFSSSISLKVIIHIVFFSFIATLFSTSFQVYQEWNRTVARLQNAMKILEDSNKSALLNAYWNTDTELMKALLKGIQSYPNIERVEFIPTEVTKKVTEIDQIVMNTIFVGEVLSADTLVHLSEPLIHKIPIGDGQFQEINAGRLKLVTGMNTPKEGMTALAMTMFATQGVIIFLDCVVLFIIFHLLVAKHLKNMADFLIKHQDISQKSEELIPIDVKRKRKDEIYVLKHSINLYLQNIRKHTYNLEKLVNIRTSQLLISNRNIEVILQQIPIGFLTLDVNGQCTSEYSKISESILHTKSIHNNFIATLILDRSTLSSDRKELVVSTINTCIGNDELNYLLNKHNLPNELIVLVKNSERVFDLSWSYVADNEFVITKILLTIKDVTDLREFQLQAENKDRELKKFAQLIQQTDKEAAESLISIATLINDLEEAIKNFSSANVKRIKLILHTIKGNARAFSYSYIAEEIHKAESEIKKHEATMLASDFSAMTEEIKLIYNSYYSSAIKLKKIQENDEVIQKQIVLGSKTTDFVKQIYNLIRRDELKAFDFEEKLRNLIDKCLDVDNKYLKEILKTHLESVHNLAKFLGKPMPKLEIYGDKKIFPASMSTMLQNTIGHLLRNSLDHGLENAEERERLGKYLNGEIKIVIDEGNGEWLKLIYEDDGRGLNIAKIKELAVESGLLVESVRDIQIIGNQIFEPGFSTKEEITEISGRGVGMSAVKTFVEEQGGIIELNLLNNFESGYTQCQFIIKLPTGIIYQPLTKDFLSLTVGT